MSPTSLIMIHNPATIAMGDHDDMKKAIAMLDEVKESIINAYEIKTSLSRDKLSRLMDAETWMNANKAVELGFADGVLEDEKTSVQIPAYAFSRKTVQAALMNKISAKAGTVKPVDVTGGTEVPEPDKKDKGASENVEAAITDTKDAEEPAEEKEDTPEVTEEPTGRSVDMLKERLATIKNFI